MKLFRKLYVKLYAYITPISLFLALLVNRRIVGVLPLLPLFIGTILLSLLIAGSYLIFKKTIGNGVPNILLSYLLAFPIPFILRWMFDAYLFQRPLFIYTLGLIYIVLYSLVVVYGTIRNKKEETKLNQLLKENEDSKDAE